MVQNKWYIHPAIAVAVLVNVFVMGLAMAWSGDPAKLQRLLVEDGIVEWMQFLCFAVTSGLLAFAALEHWQRGRRIDLPLLALAGLAGIVALAALEEISWFQRILNVTTPEYFAQNNRQGETNLHNLAIGEKGSIHKTILLKLIAIAGLTHNIVLPLLARKRPAIRDFVERFGLYLPPLSASVIYIVLVAISHLVIDHPRKGELGEMFGAVHYLATVFIAYFLGIGYGKPPIFEGPADRRRVGALFAMLLVFLLMTGWLLSAGAGAEPYLALHPNGKE
ncbi:hypothetical protein [Pseudoduganella albidiflava]|uniref:Uncharacterized protein n=1 Tax=Pseudoduganella albidiflava TaxID=321983 RepID=A0A411X3F9_9BURK|nr:hypothetical protein [Pseudoduganella albidiflava]QBI03576.1 hypothetical protein EYF70_24175 [Pseudoduganella albidiflava]GGY51126.1 hypothetical protein GCM10007387_36880 [Pseudoduganella albidiflava]